ncbi:MAG: RnfH family protein [Gammaproteobacteria bacterium]
MDMALKSLEVEIVYALTTEQCVVRLRVSAGTRIGEAIEQSGVLARFPEIDLHNDEVGVFGSLRRR